MPELPEVETVVRELNRKLSGKTIFSAKINLGKIISLGPKTVSNLRATSASKVERFVKAVKGQRILSVRRRAKLLIFNFSGPLSMLAHLKMTGQFIYLKKNEFDRQIRVVNKKTASLYSLPMKFTHAIFNFSDGSKLFYNDVRQFGYLKLVTDNELSNVKELFEFGPEPLSRNFTFSFFRSVLQKKSDTKIKQLLTDQSLIAGIGNIYSDEILFRARVKPMRKVKSLNEEERKKLFQAIPYILKKGIAARGSSVGDFIRTDGSWGTMGKYHYVYLRSGLPCKVCGRIIKSAKFNGRTGSYCPSCQK